jgi:hypothetical protein
VEELEQQEQEQEGKGEVQEEKLVRFQFRKVVWEEFIVHIQKSTVVA